MKLIVGLGNPGRTYQDTRHNVGYVVVDLLAHELGAPGWQRKFDGLLSRAAGGDDSLLLLKPETMMNDSGRSVASALNFYKLALADLWVVHDDIDLPLGKLRIKTDGRSGGHNGVASLIDALGTDAFVRFKIGVAPAERPPHFDAAHFVLSRFSESERELADNAVSETVVALTLALNEGIEKAMGFVN